MNVILFMYNHLFRACRDVDLFLLFGCFFVLNYFLWWIKQKLLLFYLRFTFIYPLKDKISCFFQLYYSVKKQDTESNHLISNWQCSNLILVFPNLSHRSSLITDLLGRAGLVSQTQTYLPSFLWWYQSLSGECPPLAPLFWVCDQSIQPTVQRGIWDSGMPLELPKIRYPAQEKLISNFLCLFFFFCMDILKSCISGKPERETNTWHHHYVMEALLQ